jgi:[ribosomal protein S5]-alanine N-acetyltransferase
MEKMPFQPDMERGVTMGTRDTQTAASVVTSDWRSALPVLTGSNFTLRELRLEDAASLLSMLTTEEVSRFISPPPTTVEGFEKFIEWAQLERAAGNYACYAVVPQGLDTAIGIFQVRTLEPGFRMAEWGFALGSQFWGTNIFAEGARLILGFTFETLGVGRLEARAAIANARGNGALRKIGAVQEGVLRRSFLRNGIHHDQMLWSFLAEDWTAQLARQAVAH